MPSVDNRVVEMRFDNDNFESGVSTSLKTIDKLKEALNFSGADKGFSDLEKAAKKGLDFSSISDNLEQIAGKFTSLGIVGVTALQEITKSALNLGKNVLTAIPNQIISGGKTRALNIEQAKFQLSGLNVLWEDIYDNIDKAVSGTAYGLDEAAVVASQLVASGIAYGDAQSDMAHALRGISGVAAMTNSSYSEIGSIFTTVAGQGKLMTMQLRQLEARGLNVAAKLGEILGKSENDIRDMVTDGKIDFITFANAMDEAFGEHATKANETFTGALANMKAALSRIGADFATPIMNAGKEVFNALRNAFNIARSFTRPFADLDVGNGEFTLFMQWLSSFAAGKISNWKFEWLGGVVEGFNNILDAAKNFVLTFDSLGVFVANLWKDIFPTSLSDRFVSITSSVKSFSERILNAVGWIKEVKDSAQEAIEVAEAGIDTVANIEEYANRVIYGEFGNGEERRQALEALGLSYERIQNKVNEILGCDYRLEVAEEDLTEATDTHSDAVENQQEAMDDANDSIEVHHSRLENLGRIIRGISSAISIVKQTISAVWRAVVQPVLRKIWEWSLPISEFLGNISDTITDVAQKWQENDTIFNGLSKIVDKLKSAWTWLTNLFTSTKANESVIALGDTLSSIWETIKGIASTVFDNISNFFGSFNKDNIPLPTIEDFATAIGWVAEKINNLITTVQGWDIWKKISDGYDKVKNYFSELDLSLPNFSEFFESLEGKSFTEKLTAIWDELKGTWEQIKTIWNDIVGMFTGSKMEEELTRSGGTRSLGMSAKDVPMVGLFQSVYDKVKPIVDSIWAVVGPVFTTIKNALSGVDWTGILGSIGRAISGFFSNLDAEKIANIGKIIASIVVLKSLGSTITTVGGAFARVLIGFEGVGGAIANTFRTLDSTLNTISETVKTYQQKQITVNILEAAAAVGILAASLWVLSKVPKEDLIKGGIALGGVIAAMLVLVGVMVAVSKWMSKSETLEKNFKALGFGMLEISASVFILAEALMVLNKVNLEGLGWKIVSLIILLGSVVTAMILIDKFAGGSIKSGLSMLLYAVSLGLIVKALDKLSVANFDGIVNNLLNLIIVIGLLGLLTRATSKSSLSAGLGIAVLLADILLVVAVMKKIADVPTEDLWAGVAKISIIAIVLAEIAVVLRLAGTQMNTLTITGKGIWKKKSNILSVAVALLMITAALLIVVQAIKQLSNIPTAKLWKGVGAISVIMAFFTAITYLSKYATKSAAMVGVGIVLMSASILLLVKAMKNVAQMSWEEVAKGILVVGGILTIFTIMTKLGAAAKGAWAAILMTTIALMAITGTILLLKDVPIANILVICLGLSAVLLAMSAAFKLAGSITKGNVGTGIVGLITVSLILGALFVALGALSDNEAFGKFVSNASAIANACIAMVPVIASIAVLEAALGAIGKWGVKSLSTGALGFVETAGAIVIFMGALALITDNDKFATFAANADLIANTFIAMIPVIGIMAVLEGVLGAIGHLGLQNIAVGALGFDILAICIAALLEFFGWLAQDPKFTEWIATGSEVLVLLSSAIGEAIGSFISGIGVGLTDGLSDIADNLNAFGFRISTFVHTMSNLSDFTGTARTAVADITAMLGDILGSQISQNLTGWMAGDVTLETMMTQLTTLAEGIKTFSDTISGDDGLNSDNIDTAVTAINSFVGIHDSMTSLSSIVSSILGLPDMSSMSGQMISLGRGIKTFNDTICVNGGLDKAAIDTAVGAIESFVGLQDQLSGLNIIIAWLADLNLGSFGTTLGDLAQGLVDYSSKLSENEIDTDAIETSVTALNSLVGLYDNLSNLENVIAWAVGLNLGSFGLNLINLANGLVSYSDHIKMGNGVDTDAIETSVTALNKLVGLYDSLTSLQNVVAWIAGLNLGSFGQNISDLGSGLKDYCTAIGTDFDGDNVANSVTALQSLADLQDSLDGLTGLAQLFTGKKEGDLTTFGSSLTGLATGLNNFATNVSNIDWEFMGTVTTNITSFSTMIDGLKALDLSGIALLINATSQFMDDSTISSFISEFAELDLATFTAATDNISGFATMIGSLVDLDTSGIDTFKEALTSITEGFTGYADALSAIDWDMFASASEQFTNFTNSIGTLATGAIDTFTNNMASLPKQLSSIGSNAIAGLTASMSALPATMGQIGTNASTALVESLSELVTTLAEMGSSAGGGLASGLSSKRGSIYSAGYTLRSSAVSSIEGMYSSFYNTGMWAAIGLANGIQDYAYRAAQAASQAGTDAKKAVDEAVGTGSPAREFIETGKWSMLGFALGIKKYSKEAITATEEVGYDVLSASSMINDAINAAFLDDHSDPVITPVVDMSQLKSGLTTAGRLLDQNAVFGAHSIAADISASANYGSKLDELISTINKQAGANEKTATINNYITVSGAENPEDYANRLVRQLNMQIRMG